MIKAKGSHLALSTLKQLHRAESAAMHMNNLRTEMQEGGKAGDDMSMAELLMAKHLRKQVMVGVIIKIGVQFSGIDAIFYYSTLMFRHANVADPQMATTLLSLVNLAMTFIAMAIMEKAGRRALIMVTWCGMCMGFFIIFCASTLSEQFNIAEEFNANLDLARISTEDELNRCALCCSSKLMIVKYVNASLIMFGRKVLKDLDFEWQNCPTNFHL